MLTVLILFFLGRQFWRDLRNPELWRRPFEWHWLVGAGLVYLAGIGLSAVFWTVFLRKLGYHPPFRAAARAYYLGHLGKYVPGKAWALFLRAGLVGEHGVPLGVAIMTSLYEVLITMASGTLLASLIFLAESLALPGPWDWELARSLATFQLPVTPGADPKVLLILALGLSAAMGLPAVPGLFNWLVRGITLPFREKTVTPPRVPPVVPLIGLMLTGVSWWLLGASLWMGLRGIWGPSLPANGPLFCSLTADLAVAYVSGFVILVVPGGVGVREFFLTFFLLADLGGVEDTEVVRAHVLMAVLVLRLIWTAAEVILAGGLYWLGSKPVQQSPNS